MFLVACEKNKSKPIALLKANIVELNDEQLQYKGKKIELNKKSKEAVENWMEYQNLSEFIPKLLNSSTKKILFNANQLALYSQQLKDSIRIESFKIPSFKIRLNVLYNEALRLQDMDSIVSITNKEIVAEHHNILEAYYAINMKIKALVRKETLQNDLLEYDHIFSNKNDTLPMLGGKAKIEQIKKNNKTQKKRVIKPFKDKSSKKRRRIEPLKAMKR